jgi:hypothetical protein
MLPKAWTNTTRRDLHHEARLTPQGGTYTARMDLYYRRPGLTPREDASYLISCFVALRYPRQGMAYGTEDMGKESTAWQVDGC